MKRYILIGLLLMSGLAAWAQQDPMFSQYYFNAMAVNPAYAGSRDALTVSALGRWQWVGMDGAPRTQTFSIHTPDGSRRNGFGLNIVNDRISYLGQTWLTAAYAYRIPMGDYKLQLGLQGTLFNWRINWNEAVLNDMNDQVPMNYANNLWLPNAGFGAFFYGDNVYAGFSIPHLLVNSLDANRPGLSFDSKQGAFAALKRHYFLMGGYVWDVSQDFKVKPSFLIKRVYGAQTEADLNLNFYFMNRFGVGASYRTGDGMVGILEYQINRQLRAGYAYDYPFTALRGYTSGSHEIMISYEFSFGNSAVVSPRVF